MGNVIQVDFPQPVPILFEFLQAFVLDLRQVIRLDCFTTMGFYGKLVINVAVMPIVCAVGCYAYYMNQKRTIGLVITAGGADESAYATAAIRLKQNIFVSIFVLYPLMCTVLFRVPQCRSLGDESFHEEDFDINCGSGSFLGVTALSMLGIMLVPVGVPTAFYMFMRRKITSLGGVSTTTIGGAKLVAEGEPDEADHYGFLVRDMQPEYWFYEIITYTRKLMLGGLALVVGRGTLAQVYFVCTVESFFLMYHMRAFPYINMKHNILDGVGHCILLLTYTCTFILKVGEQDMENEIFPRAGYGWFLVFLYVVVLPSPIAYYYLKDRRANKADSDKDPEFSDHGADNGADIFYENPLGDSPDGSTVAGSTSTASAARTGMAKLAKMAREGKEMREQLQALNSENGALRTQVEQLGGQVKQTSAALSAKDSALKAATDGAALAEANTQSAAEVAAATIAVGPKRFDARRPSQIVQMQEWWVYNILVEALMSLKGLECQASNRSIVTRAHVSQHRIGPSVQTSIHVIACDIPLLAGCRAGCSRRPRSPTRSKPSSSTSRTSWRGSGTRAPWSARTSSSSGPSTSRSSRKAK
jgi:hypothetical protein